MALQQSPRWRHIPKHLWYIFGLVLLSRLGLTIIGALVRLHHWHFTKNWVLPGPLSSHVWLNVWGLWDTGWYYRIASEWYSGNNLLSFAFFPVYPGITRLLGYVGGHYFVAGLVISNIALLISCWLLYKIAGTKQQGLWAVLALISFPSAFVLSGMFSEALYLCIALATFFFALQKKWILAGLFGFLLSLSRPVGFLIVIPITIEYLQSVHWSWKSLDRRVVWLFLIPLGLPLWAWYNYHLTGDWINFVHVQALWHRGATNPISALWTALRADNFYDQALALASIATAIFLVLFHRVLRWSERAWGWLSLLIPLFTGIYSMPRYILVIFPLYLGFARISIPKIWRIVILLVFCVIQLGLFIYWPKQNSWVV